MVRKNMGVTLSIHFFAIRWSLEDEMALSPAEMAALFTRYVIQSVIMQSAP